MRRFCGTLKGVAKFKEFLTGSCVSSTSSAALFIFTMKSEFRSNFTLIMACAIGLCHASVVFCKILELQAWEHPPEPSAMFNCLAQRYVVDQVIVVAPRGIKTRVHTAIADPPAVKHAVNGNSSKQSLQDDTLIKITQN